MQLKNYIAGQWVAGTGKLAELHDASTGELIATTSSGGLDFKAMLHYARETGGPPLRKMTFPERGRMLKALAMYLMDRKDEFYQVSYKTGATKADSWVDIEGGIGNVFANASLRKQLGNMPFYVDGPPVLTSRTGTFMGHHIMVPKEGVAVHINAFNFPIWGMLEKCAVNWMAGMPAVVKPATVTSFLTEAMVKAIIESKILPEGALQLIVGSAGDLLDHVESQDVVTFTGSATTGRMLKAHPRIIAESVPFNMEADSLNSIVLGPDATPDTRGVRRSSSKEVGKEMTLKCGQRCTGARRIMVPENLVEDVQIAFGQTPRRHRDRRPACEGEGVRMGALAGPTQRKRSARATRQIDARQRAGLRRSRASERYRRRCHQGRLHEPHPAAEQRSVEEPTVPQHRSLRTGEHAYALQRYRRSRGPHQARQRQPLRQHRHVR
jgi:oxepin-CoA hydrolase/3-oxo-5,6-dehydrosuberyl-CoA semialdehyde dehydrogenase